MNSSTITSSTISKGYITLRPYLHCIFCANPSPFTYMGNNVFLVGSGKQLTMIDSGPWPELAEPFISHLKAFFSDYGEATVNQILVTHGHYDHIGGLPSVLEVLKERKQDTPKIVKKLDGNVFETEFFDRFPEFKDVITQGREGDIYEIEAGVRLRSLETPGHISDHLSFMLETPKENILVSGDIILGGPSTKVEHMKTYMETLYRLRKENFDWVCVPHSLDFSPEGVCLPGKEKLEAYIKYREAYEHKLLSNVKDNMGASIDTLYEALYGDRNLDGVLRKAAYSNLQLQLDKLIAEKRVKQDEAKQWIYKL